MKLIVITLDKFFDYEVAIINHLFDNGLEVLHLRKPDSKEKEVKTLIENINPQYYNRIILHDHFSLLDKFPLKGVHLNKRNPIAPEKIGISVSCSFHTLEELGGKYKYNYVFLSPVFDSISKSGYNSTFTCRQLKKAHKNGWIDERVIALGGINSETASIAKNYGFGGVAVLGALWGNPLTENNNERVIKRFDELKNICNQ